MARRPWRTWRKVSERQRMMFWEIQMVLHWPVHVLEVPSGRRRPLSVHGRGWHATPSHRTHPPVHRSFSRVWLAAVVVPRTGIAGVREVLLAVHTNGRQALDGVPVGADGRRGTLERKVMRRTANYSEA